MLNISKASLLMGLRETLANNNYRIVNTFFGSRFSRDRRYRVWCMCGTDNGFYGTVGGHEFYIAITKWDATHRPCEFVIALCDSHLIASDVWRTTVIRIDD